MRIKSHPVRRTIPGRPEIRTLASVEAYVDMRWIDGERVVVHAVFPLAGGGVGVVERISADEWRAAGAMGGWLPETFEDLFTAVEAVVT
jgi:hypothetical protein